MSAIRVDIADDVGPRLVQFINGLKSREGLHQSIGVRAGGLVKSHLIGLSQSRHKTAEALGASPTGHLGRAAESVSHEGNADGATVSVTSPGFSRVEKDLQIRPVNGNWLTIPLNRLAYGQRVRETERALQVKLFRPGPKGAKKNVLAARGPQGELTIFYALSKSVTLKRDRTLLPTDDEFRDAAIEGIKDYVGRLLRQKN